ncbi:DUF4352 domain-containing protein [Fictibacillus terranigra]|uniref:DUF4352 domain-containing protein n=1 Tax=Fictibacillus terranigra TaxID=3058424 RepID=A0ABT8E4L3_9BACL|nr:DUF4352 domain-containing protein [Fictibacillus sp. CENA-BCM004]MDN4072829.1 DUF4352 domain-containing protein [Fictibacillus sp. CENA-BCM004]
MRSVIVLLSLAVFLFGCSTNEPAKNEQPAETKGKTTGTEKNKPERKGESKDVHVPNPQVSDDRNLTKIGQTIDDSKGEMTLKGIKNVNKHYNHEPISLTIKDVKLIHHKPDNSMIDFFHSYTHEEEFDFVKIAVEIKNNSDKTVKFAPVALIKTSDGQKKMFDEDIYLEELGGEMKENSTKEGTLGFIVEEAKQPIQWVEVTTSDVFNQNDKLIHKAQTIKIDLNR